MALGTPVRPREPLRVWLMLAALVLAAFLGAAAGLVWQRFFADETPQEVGSDGTGDEAGASPSPRATPSAPPSVE